jgi:hypothetical protein
MKQKKRSNPGLAELEYLMVIYCNSKEKESIRKYSQAGRPVRKRDCELQRMSICEEETVKRRCDRKALNGLAKQKLKMST